MPWPKGTHGSHGPSAHAYVHKQAKAFDKDTPRVLASELNCDPETQAYRAERRAENRDLRARMMAVLVANAEDKSAPNSAQITAADKVLDRIDGKPIAHVDLKANVRRTIDELTDDELIALAGSGASGGGDGEAEGGTE